MKEIEELLIKNIKERLEECNKNKTVPSRDVLDTIMTYAQLINNF